MARKPGKAKKSSKASTSQNLTSLRTQFRSNLTKVIALLKGIQLLQPHIDLLQTTPFYNFFAPFIAGKAIPEHVVGSKHAVEAIVHTFNKDQDRIIIGGKELKIEPAEFDFIFGRTSGELEIDNRTSSISSNSAGKRHFPGIANIYPSIMKAKLKEIVSRNTQTNIEDTVKLIIIHALAFIFFVATQDVVRNWMFRLVDDLPNLHKYKWGKMCSRAADGNCKFSFSRPL